VYGGIVYYRYLSTIAVTEMIAFGIGYPEAFMRRSLNEISIGLIYIVLFSNKNVISVKGTSFAASTYIVINYYHTSWADNKVVQSNVDLQKKGDNPVRRATAVKTCCSDSVMPSVLETAN
jgi:riboflavin synthase